MTWALFRDLAFYAVLGLFAFCPIVVFVAAVSGKSFETARGDVTRFLESVGTLAPSNFTATVLHTAGISTILFMLAFCAYAASRVGDAVAPTTARWCSYFGDARVRWSVEHSRDEYRDVKFKLRELSEVRGDRVRWEETKAGLGANDVRLCRTMLVLAGLVCMGGIIGIVRERKRSLPWWKRSAAWRKRSSAWRVAVVGLCAVVMSQWLWVERESNYVENLVSRYQSETLKMDGMLPDLPSSYPGSAAGRGP